MNESILKTAFGRFKKSAPSYLAVGILCGLFMALLAMLSFIDTAIFLLTIPLFALPFLFASFIACYYLEGGFPVNISSFFRYYFGYFRPQFRGCFKGIKYFLLALACYMGGLMVAYLVACYIFFRKYGTAFQDSLEALIFDYLQNNLSYEEIYAHLETNDGMLLTFMTYVTAFPIVPGYLMFIYGTSFSSLSIYYRTNAATTAPSLIRLAVNQTYVENGRKMRKDWFKLNWLLLVLPLLGAGVAIAIYFLLINNPSYLSPIIMLGCSIPYIFFLPFYFPNMEVLYHHYQHSFKDGSAKAIKMVLNRIQNTIDLSEEEKRSIEESFRSGGEDKEE